MSAVCSYGLLVHHICICLLQNNVGTEHFVFCYTNILQRHYGGLKKCVVRQQRKNCRFKSVMAVQVSTTICTGSNRQLRHMLHTLDVCTMRCKEPDERVSGYVSGSRNVSWQHSHHSSQRY
jgi:hypothetical protein